MDYTIDIFKTSISSDQNIKFIIDKIRETYNLSKKSVAICENKLRVDIVNILQKNEFAISNKNDFCNAMHTVNKEIYDNFMRYMREKYPPVSTPPISAQQTTIVKPDTSDKEPDSEMIIITEEQKNKILNKIYGDDQPETTSDIFLTWLSNPTIIKLFNETITRINKPLPQYDIKYDAIITEDHLTKLLNLDKSLIDYNTSVQKIIYGSCENKEVPEISIENMENVKAYVEKLLRDKQLCGDQPETLENIEKEINNVRDKISKLKEQKVDNKIELKTQWINDDNDTNIKYLMATCNSFNNSNNMTKYNIDLNEESKIKIISVIYYHIPKNKNNIHNNNNKFFVYADSKMHKVIILPGIYTIDEIIEYLTTKLSFINFTMSDETITIAHKNDIKFDFLPQSKPLLRIFGFTHEGDYKDKICYGANAKYNINANENIYLNFHGSSSDNLKLDYDVEKTCDIAIKKSSSGIMLKQISFNFLDDLGNVCDFDKDIKIKFKITYS